MFSNYVDHPRMLRFEQKNYVEQDGRDFSRRLRALGKSLEKNFLNEFLNF